jgi:hypothetical protein
MLGKHTLDPKEKTELKVHYATEGRPGPFEKVITLTTNIPGQEKIDIFKIKGEVREAPAAKISVAPRRITFEGNERSTGKTQALAITNEGSLPLVITGIHSKDGKTIYYDGAKEGNITIEPAQTKTIEIHVEGGHGESASREFIIIDSNAKNAGKSGYFLILE